MSHVQITLASGVTVTADVSEWRVKRNPLGDLSGFSWTNDGPRSLTYVRAEDVVAAVFVDEEPEA